MRFVLLKDLRFVLRSLRRAPVVTLTAAFTLAIGIGLCSAMFGVARQVLLAPLPYAQPDRLVALNFGFRGEPASDSQVGSAADFIRQYAHAYASFGISDGGVTEVNVADAASGPGHASAAQQLRVSRDFLPTLGIVPRLGRGFSQDEDRPGGPRAVLLSDTMWRTQFGGDPNIVGRLIRIDEENVPVVGVLSPDVVADMQGGTREQPAAGIFQPLQLGPKDDGYDGDNYAMIARLRDGVTPGVAQEELHTLLPEFARQHAWYSRWRRRDGRLGELRVFPLKAALVGDVRNSLLLVLAAAAAVMLIACLNLAGLTASRAAARTRELAVRSALGAGQAALLRLLLTEAAVLACVGAAAGLLVARGIARVFVAHAPLALPHLQPATAVWPMAAASVALAVFGMMLFGLLPALVVLGREVNQGLRNAGSQGQSVRYVRTSRVLVIAQVALTFVLVVAASLLMHTFLAMHAVAPGIRPDQVTIGQVTLKGDAYGKTERYAAMTSRVLEALAHTPGVVSAGAVNGLPLDRGLNNGGWPAGRKEEAQSIETRFVSPDYMRAIGITLLRGRGVRDTDSNTAPKVVVINKRMADLWWPNGDAIGHRLNIGNSGDREIIGIARDTREHSLLEQSRPLAYVPIVQNSDAFTRMINNWFPTSFVVRADAGVNAAEALASAVRSADPELPLTRITSMQDVVNSSMATPEFFGAMSSGVAIFTLLLAAVGLFGLLSYQVTQRTREIVVRIALGATRGNILASFVRRGLFLTLAGLGLGALLSIGLPRLLSAALEEFAAVHSAAHAWIGDAEAGAVAAVLLLTVTTVASLAPAGRASSVEPMQALRSE